MAFTRDTYAIASRCFCAASIALLSLTGCQTRAAKIAMAKPQQEDSYSGFGDKAKKESARPVRAVEPVQEDMEPEKAVDLLVEHLQRQDPAYFIPAENELMAWGSKQGVPEMIVSKVRLLSRHPRIEVRASALRLMCMYGSKEVAGDMIEVLADEDYGMRKTAFEHLRSKTGRDFGYHPSHGQLARAGAIEKFRSWWQEEKHQALAENIPLQKLESVAPPVVSGPDKRNKDIMISKGDAKDKKPQPKEREQQQSEQ